MRHTKSLALTGLVLSLALPGALRSQVTVVAPAAPPTPQAPAVVTGLSSSASAREAVLTFFLADGGSRVIALRDGRVLVDGETVASYQPRGDVEREWRKLVAWTTTLSPDEAVAAIHDWSVEGTFDGEAQAALKALSGVFVNLQAESTVAVPAAPSEDLTEAAMAVMEAREASRLARAEVARVREQIRHSVRVGIQEGIEGGVNWTEPEVAEVSFATPFGTVLGGALGLGGTFLALCAIAFGSSFFAGRQLDVMADAVSTSFARSFFVGLFAQPLILPALGAVIVGLTLTVVGILLIPVAIVAFAATLVAAVVGGYLAVARVAGSSWMHRLRGNRPATPFGLLQSFAWGLAIVLAVWLPAILLGWMPVAGNALTWLAAIVTWGLATTGFGAAVLTRGGVRTTFGRRFHPAELPAATLYEQPGPEISTAEWMAGRAR
jgi:hypothetical protein